MNSIHWHQECKTKLYKYTYIHLAAICIYLPVSLLLRTSEDIQDVTFLFFFFLFPKWDAVYQKN